MGCDIHCYLEYKRPGSEHWSSFGGRIKPGRNYDFFARLAGVRNSIGVEPILPLRGFPKDAGWAAKGDNYLFIVDDDDRDGAGEGSCARSLAERWVREGSSEYSECRRYVTHPDWHSHSWVPADAFEQAIPIGERSPVHSAILAALRSFESDGFEARVVFWFDN